MKKIIFVLMFSFSFFVLGDVGSIERITNRITKDLNKSIDQQGIPGARAAFYLADHEPVSIEAGFADLELDKRVDQKTLFPSGSIGKSFYAALCLVLQEQGKLDLDAPISTWLGQEPWFDRLANSRTINLRQLLNHTSGLPDMLDQPGLQRFLAGECKKLRKKGVNLHALLLTDMVCVNYILDKPALFKPGKGFHYSNAGYRLVGMILKRITGEHYHQSIVKHVIKPLGLTHTVPQTTPFVPGIASGYSDPSNPFGLPRKMAEDGVFWLHPGNETTDGGFITTPVDQTRWARGLFEGGLLSGDSKAQITEAGVANGSTHYGLGWYVVQTDAGPAYYHTGYFPGYLSALIYLPQAKLALAVQINTSTTNITDLMNRLTIAVLQEME